MSESKGMRQPEGVDTAWNPLESISSEVSKTLDSGDNTRALVLEAIYSGTFDGVSDEGSLAHELESRGYSQEEADVLAPWLMQKRQEFLSNVGAKEGSDVGTYSPLRSVSSEVSKALHEGKFTRALVLEAIFSGTFDGAPDEASVAYELESRGYTEEEADVLAPWIMEKRQEFLSHVGAEESK